jgi:hypothetical protein
MYDSKESLKGVTEERFEKMGFPARLIDNIMTALNNTGQKETNDNKTVENQQEQVNKIEFEEKLVKDTQVNSTNNE